MNTGIHWLRPDGKTACGEEPDRVTPAMAGATCRDCRDVIDYEIESIVPASGRGRWAEGTMPPPAPGSTFKVPMPPPLPPSGATIEALAALNEELEGFRGLFG